MAAECVRLAQDVRDETNKALLLEMALAWIRLAARGDSEPGERSSEQPASDNRPSNWPVRFYSIAVLSECPPYTV
jgi:hypothetical protein